MTKDLREPIILLDFFQPLYSGGCDGTTIFSWLPWSIQ
jgi:hypothetical protein